ncbi:MAG: nickel pincer cofactor biosynthesis protein LarC [Desulfobulbus sp.]|nr:nickel pincer cofactor biosynthesis protein LarC [Desulfobulbus sp.]
MRTAYLDCFSGVSGDMLLGALLDAGVPESYLRELFSGLLPAGYKLTVTRKTVQGLVATRVQISDTEHHEHPHRHLQDIHDVLNQADIPASVRDRSFAVFARLAGAEAAVHGTTVESVHFHEVGAVDAILDVVGTVAGLSYLNIDRLCCSPLPMTHGWVHCSHGDIPLPSPAVCRLLEGVPVYGLNIDQELVTPTGAALVRELTSDFGPMPAMRLLQTGYGAGTLHRRDGRPNLLRLLIGESREMTEAQEVDVIETHIDDWNPELWPHVSERLLAAGALDVCLIPMHMKKGRPGFLLRVITESTARPALTTILFSETSTIGLRWRSEQRLTLPRLPLVVTTPWGDVTAKQITTPTGTMITPEYESCRALAEKEGIPLQTVYAAVQREAHHRGSHT